MSPFFILNFSWLLRNWRTEGGWQMTLRLKWTQKSIELRNKERREKKKGGGIVRYRDRVEKKNFSKIFSVKVLVDFATFFRPLRSTWNQFLWIGFGFCVIFICLKKMSRWMNGWCESVELYTLHINASILRLSAIEEAVRRLSVVCHVHELDFDQEREVIARYSWMRTSDDFVLAQPVGREWPQQT